MHNEAPTYKRITFKDVKALFTDKLWGMETDFASKAWKGIVRFMKLARLTLDSFAEHRMGFQCVALSYFVTLAIIPLVAFMFFLSNGLHVSDRVAELLHQALSDNLELVDIAIEKANNIIEAATSGPVGVISAIMFIWTIIWLMFQIERVFNNVWGIRRIPRNILTRFGFYIGFLFLLPFLIVILCYGIVLYSNAPSLLGIDIAPLHRFLGWVIFYAITVFTLSAAYKYIPACKVEYRNALTAALFLSLVFVGFQYLYLETQVFVTRLNAVYGVIAAIPLFLIWLNFSFQIIMYGAQLTYALQNVDEYRL